MKNDHLTYNHGSSDTHFLVGTSFILYLVGTS
jgi:hypothetical protein